MLWTQRFFVLAFQDLNMKFTALFITAAFLQGCTLLAVADAAGSAAVYAVKTTVNVIDAVTPDIVNKKK
jgi:hypothetical protein